MDQLVQVEVADGVALLRLNAPPLNLVSRAMTQAMLRVLPGLASDAAVRAVVVAGAGGRAFCAGSDIKEFERLMAPGAAVEGKLYLENVMYSALDELPKPTVAAIEGAALGGGLELALCCDLIVTAHDARLALPETRLGVFPGSGGTVRATRRVGVGRAKEMMFLGDPVAPETALAWGLVNRVCEPGAAVETAMALARRLADGPTATLGLCKQAIGLAFDHPQRDVVSRTLPLIDAAFSGEEIRRGAEAFLAKRPPQFREG
jgi:enoyl-CoA hydratase/carnithine racemase